MERTKAFFIALIAFLTMAAQAKAYYDFEKNGFRYTIIGLNIVEVSGAVDDEIETIVIPSSVENEGKEYTVMKIGDAAFNKKTKLREVVLPETVLSLGNYAFSGCSSLLSFQLPEGTTEISEGLFEACSSLKEVTNIENVSIFERLCFQNCISLTDFPLSNNVTNIGEYAFSGCININFVVNDDNPVFKLENGVLYDYTKNMLSVYPASKIETSFTCPSFVTIIGETAFAGNPYIEEIILPYSVKTILMEAFDDCTSLRNVFIPYDIKSIPLGAFHNCVSLEEITLPNNVTRVEFWSFYNCPSLSIIKCWPQEPPVCADPSIYPVTWENCTLYVRPESIELYKAADIWGNFKNILPLDEEENSVAPQRIEIMGYPDKLEVGKAQKVYAEVYPVDVTTPVTIDWSVTPDIKAYIKGNSIFPIEPGVINLTASIAEHPSVTQTVTLIIVGKGENSVEELAPDPEGLFNVFDMEGKTVMVVSDRNKLSNLKKGLYIINGKKVIVKN